MSALCLVAALTLLGTWGGPAQALAGMPPAGAEACNPQFVPVDAPNIQARMNDCPAGTTYTFAAGTYRLARAIVPKDGDHLQGAGSDPAGTRFTGSIVLGRWTRTGQLWVHDGDAVNVGIIESPCRVGTACDYQDWLFRDGQFLDRVLAPCTILGAKQFCVDYQADKIYIGSKPGTSLYEYATLKLFINGRDSSDVTVRDVSFDEFASAAGAMLGGAGWHIEHVRGHLNHACALSLPGSSVDNPATVQDSQFDENGWFGYCNPSNDTIFLNDDWSFNNALRFQHGGGLVIHGSDQGRIQGNTIHDNDGDGVSIQSLMKGVRGSHGMQIVGNTVYDNNGYGIEVHWSCQTTISSNVLWGQRHFAIEIYDANSNTITNNTVRVPSTSLHGGIRVLAGAANGSNDCGSWNDASNNIVTGNDVTMGSVQQRGLGGNINGVVNLKGRGRVVNEVFAGNAYHMPQGDCAVGDSMWWDGSTERRVRFADWQSGLSQDLPPDGTCGV